MQPSNPTSGHQQSYYALLLIGVFDTWERWSYFDNGRKGFLTAIKLGKCDYCIDALQINNSKLSVI